MKSSASLLLRLISLFLIWNSNRILCSAAEQESEKTGDDTNKTESTAPPRVFSLDELKVANGVESDNLYLCVCGRVYDVAAGKEYYAPDGPYHVFVGRDAPVPFVTGIFTDEEAAKPWDALEQKQHGGLLSWIDFYENEEKYPFIGVVQGVFYDQNGHATPELERLNQAMEEARAEQKRREIERKRKREERDKKRKEKKEMEMMTGTAKVATSEL